MSCSEDLKYAENLVEKAWGHIERTRDELKRCPPNRSNVIELYQTAIELSG
ncbi:MAG: hypothetical protein QXJ18_01185 [Desulfurococcaceae archaeon]